LVYVQFLCSFLTRASLFAIGLIILFFLFMYVLLGSSWLLFGHQYQCNRLPEKARLRNNPLCVECDVNLSSVSFVVTHSDGKGLCIVEFCSMKCSSVGIDCIIGHRVLLFC